MLIDPPGLTCLLECLSLFFSNLNLVQKKFDFCTLENGTTNLSSDWEENHWEKTSLSRVAFLFPCPRSFFLSFICAADNSLWRPLRSLSLSNCEQGHPVVVPTILG